MHFTLKAMTALAVMGALVAPASAQTLWKDISAGMTADDVHALYPAVKGKVKHYRDSTHLAGIIPVDQCFPSIGIKYPKGTVTEVSLSMGRYNVNGGSCRAEVYAGLLAKYGEPMTENRELVNAFVGAGRYTVTNWVKDGVAITFSREIGDPFNGWTLTYKPVSSDNL